MKYDTTQKKPDGKVAERCSAEFTSRQTVSLPRDRANMFSKLKDSAPEGLGLGQIGPITSTMEHSSAYDIRKYGIVLGGVIFGICLSVAAVFLTGKSIRDSVVASTGASSPAAMRPAPVQPVAAEIFMVPHNEIATEVEVHQTKIVPDVKIEEYANSLPLEFAPRDFLYYSNAQRTVGASMLKPDMEVYEAESVSVTRRTLEAKGSEGRFISRNDKTEWQGEFKLDTPAENLSKGQEYATYVGQQNTSSLDDLQVIRVPKNRLVNTITGKRLQPKR